MGYEEKIKSTILHLNPWLLVTFTQRMSHNFGYKFTLLLSSVYYGIKGAGYYFAKDALLPYAERVGLEGTVVQLNSTISTIPWSIKGFIGVISDSFALFGYHKKWYMILSCAAGSIASGLLIFLPFDASRNFNLLPGILLFWVHLEGSATDLLCEGKYVEKMRSLPHTKADVVTYIWFCQTVGNMIPGFTVGPIADFGDVRYVYAIAFVCLAQPLYFLFTNCMVDDDVPRHLANKWKSDKWAKEWKMMTLAIILAVLVLGTLLTALFSNNLGRLIYGIVISVILCGLAHVLMPTVIANGNLYIFLIRMLYLNVSGAVDYFYRKGPECVEDGSNFPYVFYRTYATIVSIIFNFVGLYLFQIFISSWNFRPAFWVTTFLRVLASLFDIILILRWNRVIGIPDEIVFLLGNTAIVETVYMMDFMPMNLLIAKLCPRDVETTMYSILAGYMNFGASMASYIGLYLTQILGIDTQEPTGDGGDGDPCNWDNLVYLVLIGHCILPLISIPLTFILIPNAKVDDDIVTFRQKVYSKHNQHAVVAES